jgi:hypothetical protein
MTADPTAQARRDMIASRQPATDLAVDQGQRWDTAGLQHDFEVVGFAAPFVVVRRRSDGQVGTLEFTHHPRVYFGWRPDGELGPARAAATEAVTRAPEARQLRLAGLHPCSGQGGPYHQPAGTVAVPPS